MYEESFVTTYSTNNRDIRSFLGYPNDYPLEQIVNDLIAYFRKSRKDEELYKNEATEETLARHIKTIQEWSINVFGAPIPEENIKKEVVSGETIEGRPIMQQVLKLVENPKYRAIICVDVQRLGRGDLEDQGRIIKTLRFSNTKILTPNQLFDLNNNFDKKFFEQKMRESKEYLEYVKEIMGNGRIRSVLDGTWPHSTAPYGFNRIKIDGAKGYTLEYNKNEYNVCKLIISLLKDGLNIQYTIQKNDTISSIAKTFGITKETIINYNTDISLNENEVLTIFVNNPGTSIISNYLNFLNIKPRKANRWTPAMIRNILLSLPAHGFVSWGNRKTVITLQDGTFLKSRPKNKQDSIIIRGRWNPIYSDEDIEIINQYFSNNHKPIRKDKSIKNPLVGLVKCSICNSNMQRRPYTSINKKRNKRLYEINKIELQRFLREHKGNLSITEIARNSHISRDIIAHIFSPNINTFTIPKTEYWEPLKKALNLHETEFDKALTTFSEDDIQHTDTLICSHNNCCNISSDLELVEKKIIESLKIILSDYKDYINNYSNKVQEEIKSNEISLEIINKQIVNLNDKLNKICDLLENGTYTQQLFLERKTKIDIELSNLEKKKKQLSTNQLSKKYEERKKMIPNIENVLHNYNDSLNPEQKNKLLSTIIKVIYYKKEKGGKNHKENFQLKIYLKI